jgi:anaerobic magnesium-protoporphyrin IX monomethyl ester cyclase
MGRIMKFALVNPNWSFDGSIYFGCRDPHLPLEFGYAKSLLMRAGHEAVIIDAHLENLHLPAVQTAIETCRPDFVVVTTAPTYLFWRCPQPELRVPMALLRSLRDSGSVLIAVGPHGSTTPRAVLSKLGVDAVIMGEFEEILPRFSDPNWLNIPSICHSAQGEARIQGRPWSANLDTLPPLTWPDQWIKRHDHHHHRFDTPPRGPGAEVEASRGCPYTCSFCAKENCRNLYRKRPLPILLKELDRLLDQGVEYVYFIDEIFLCDPPLLQALLERQVKFGIQTRIDLWRSEELELLGRAGCVSIEAGVESITPEGRRQVGKPCRLSTEQIVDRLITAKKNVPFVQANLVRTEWDHPGAIREWREELLTAGVWANDPVPLFIYPGSPAYRRLWGDPDDRAWERAHGDYLARHESLSDLQEGSPRSLAELEQWKGAAHV